MAEHPTYGWWFPPGSRKAHYKPEGGDRSLCRHWGFFGAPPAGIFEADSGPSPDDCKQCRRKMEVAR